MTVTVTKPPAALDVALTCGGTNVAGTDVTGADVGSAPEPASLVSCSAAVGLTRKAVDSSACIAL